MRRPRIVDEIELCLETGWTPSQLRAEDAQDVLDIRSYIEMRKVARGA